MISHHYNDTLVAPHAETDEAGNLTWQENYAPYGKKLQNEHAELSNHVGYTGKPHERITGFTYLNARYYDPIIGRFMAVDPMQCIDIGNQYFQRYTYADNNPYKYKDPSGETLLGNLIGFGVGFVLEASIQSMEGDYDLGALVASAALNVSLDTASTAAVNAAKGDDIDPVDLAMGAIGGKAVGSLAKKYVSPGAKPAQIEPKSSFESNRARNLRQQRNRIASTEAEIKKDLDLGGNSIESIAGKAGNRGGETLSSSIDSEQE